MDYFDVPTPVGLWVSQYGSDVTGNGTKSNPYATYAKAITIGNTRINIISGYYNMGASYITIRDTMYNVGFCNYHNYKATGYALLVGQVNTMINTYISGANVLDYFAYNATNCDLSNNYVVNMQNQVMTGPTITGIITIQKNVFTSTTAANRAMIFDNPGFICRDNYISGTHNAVFQQVYASYSSNIRYIL